MKINKIEKLNQSIKKWKNHEKTQKEASIQKHQLLNIQPEASINKEK